MALLSRFLASHNMAFATLGASDRLDQLTAALSYDTTGAGKFNLIGNQNVDAQTPGTGK